MIKLIFNLLINICTVSCCCCWIFRCFFVLIKISYLVDSISDPDLMILYDGLPHNYVSLGGYPPWHIRLTEIANCSNYHDLDYNLFSKCLYRFSKVQQRFGH